MSDKGASTQGGGGKGATREPHRVAVAAGQAATRLGHKRALEASGMRVFAVTRAAQVLEAVRTTHFDAVVLDIDLPDLDTLEACHQLKMMEATQAWGGGERRTPAIVVVIAGPEPRHVSRAMRAGADNILARPFDDELLVERVRVAIEGDDLATWSGARGDPGEAGGASSGEEGRARDAREDERLSNLLVSTLYDTARVIDLAALTSSLNEELDISAETPSATPPPPAPTGPRKRPLSGFKRQLERAISGGVEAGGLRAAATGPDGAAAPGPTLTCRLSRDGRIVEGGESWHAWRGTSPGEGLGGRFTDLVEERERPAWHEALRSALSSRKPRAIRCRMRDAAGQASIVAWRMSPRPGGDGVELLGQILTGVDSEPTLPVSEATSAPLAAARRAMAQASMMERQLALTRGVARAAVLLARGTSGDFDRQATEALGEVGRPLDCDRVSLYQLDASGGMVVLTHRWSRDGVRPAQGTDRMRPTDAMPWLMTELRALRPIAVEHIEDLPPEAAAEAAALRRDGARSLCAVPLANGGALSGFVQIEARRKPVAWSTASLDAAAQLAELAAHSLATRARDVAGQQARKDRHAVTRMDAMRRLMAGFSREFSDLISVADGHRHLLMERTGPSREDLEDLHAIGEAARRARELLDAFDGFSRRRGALPVKVDVNERVGAMGRMLRALAGPGMEIEITCGATLPTIITDPDLLRLATVISVLAAAEGMGGRGHVWVRTLDGPRQAMGRPGVIVEVSDDGPNRVAALRRSLARRCDLTATDPNVGHEDLSQVAAILRELRGRLDVYPRAGGGTRLRLTLPRRAVTVKAVTRSHQRTEGGTRRPRPDRPATVLVVDDEPLLRRMAARVLKRHGHVAHEAGSGEEAIATAKELGEPLDLLVTDLGMPGMGGAELARKLLADRPDLAILLMSGYPDGTAEALRAEGVRASCLTKPFQAAVLAKAARELLSGAGEETGSKTSA